MVQTVPAGAGGSCCFHLSVSSCRLFRPPPQQGLCPEGEEGGDTVKLATRDTRSCYLIQTYFLNKSLYRNIYKCKEKYFCCVVEGGLRLNSWTV